MDDKANTLKAVYNRLATNRTTSLMRARTASKYTIPSLLPPEGHTGTAKLKVTYSSYGARCVNSLTAKLVLALLPPKSPFFKLVITDEVLAKMGGNAEMRATLEEALGKMEQRVVEEIETSMARPSMVEAVKHLVVAGNVLTCIKPDNSLKVFSLSNYVVKRDPAGNVLQIVAMEKLSPMEVPPEVSKLYMAKVDQDGKKTADDTLELYTGVMRTATGWKIHQELQDIVIPGSEGSYPTDESPWNAQRWTSVDGEDYGRGIVEEYLGDLIAVEGLTSAIVKGAAAAAKMVILVNPTGVTKKQAIARAETGDAIDGREDDVHCMSLEKSQDFRVAMETRQDIMTGLAYAFLMNQAIQRDAERVTAEEIRYMANDLDTSLGGIYSTLSVELQLPYVRRLMNQLQRTGKLPQLPKGVLKPMIVTGIEALGRGADLDKLRMFVKDVVELGGPEALGTYIHFDDLMKRLATARGIPTEGLVKTAEEVAADQEQAMQQQMMQQLGPNAVNQAGGLAKEAMKATAGDK